MAPYKYQKINLSLEKAYKKGLQDRPTINLRFVDKLHPCNLSFH